MLERTCERCVSLTEGVVEEEFKEEVDVREKLRAGKRDRK
jgi:hypothetical protein